MVFDHLKTRNPFPSSVSAPGIVCVASLSPSLKTTICSCAAQSVRFSLPPQGTSRMAGAHGGSDHLRACIYDSCGAARSRASSVTSPGPLRY
eukprot:scaffold11587_cov56-Phaeocystis_antarctica.AAC.3